MPVSRWRAAPASDSTTAEGGSGASAPTASSTWAWAALAASATPEPRHQRQRLGLGVRRQLAAEQGAQLGRPRRRRPGQRAQRRAGCRRPPPCRGRRACPAPRRWRRRRARRRPSGTPCRSGARTSPSASIVGPGQVADDAADAAGGGEQRRRLAVDRAPGSRPRCGRRRYARLELAHLALAQPADRGGQQPGHLGAQRRGELRRPGQQEVAGQDRPQVAPAGVHALDGAPGGGLVDDVVVVERADVDELDRHAAGHGVVEPPCRPRRTAVAAARRGHGEQRALALAAGPDQVRRHLGERRVVGVAPRRQEPLLDPLAGRAPCQARRAGGWGRPSGQLRSHSGREAPGGRPPDACPVTRRSTTAWSAGRSRVHSPPRIPRLVGGRSLVRTVHRPGPPCGGARPRGSSAPQPQLHRHRAHPAGPDPRGRGGRRQGARVPRHLPRGRASAGRGDHRPGRLVAVRPHPLHAPGQEGPRAVAARGAPARPQLHRHRAHPARPHP